MSLKTAETTLDQFFVRIILMPFNLRKELADGGAIYLYIYIHACKHAYIHTCIHTYMHTYIHTHTHTDVRALAVLHICHDIQLHNAGVVCQLEEHQTTLAQSSMIGRKTARNVTAPTISGQSSRVRGQRMQEMMSRGMCHDVMHRNAGPACQS